MPTNWVDFKELRAKIKFADVLAHFHVEVKVRGEKGMGFCPLPNHPRKEDGKRHTPSFSVHLTRNIFQCFACKASGNAIDFFCLMSGGNPHDAVSLRASALKLQETFLTHDSQAVEVSAPRSAQPAPAADIAATAPKKPTLPVVVNAPLEFELNLDPTHPYLSSRGFIPATIEHFGLGYSSKGMMANRIAIPLHDAVGKLVGYAGRLVDDSKISADTPKYLLPGTRERNGVEYQFHKSELLYNFHRIEGPVTDLVVVEGFASTWWLHQAGFDDVVALIGSSCSTAQADLISRLLLPEAQVWILSDGDDAGDLCAHSLFAQVAPRHPCRWVKLTAGRQPTDCTTDELFELLVRSPTRQAETPRPYRPERSESD